MQCNINVSGFLHFFNAGVRKLKCTLMEIQIKYCFVWKVWLLSAFTPIHVFP